MQFFLCAVQDPELLYSLGSRPSYQKIYDSKYMKQETVKRSILTSVLHNLRELEGRSWMPGIDPPL